MWTLAHTGLTHQDATDLVLAAITAPGMVWSTCECSQIGFVHNTASTKPLLGITETGLMQDLLLLCPVLLMASSCC